MHFLAFLLVIGEIFVLNGCGSPWPKVLVAGAFVAVLALVACMYVSLEAECTHDLVCLVVQPAPTHKQTSQAETSH